MPKIGGIEVIQRLKADASTATIPIIDQLEPAADGFRNYRKAELPTSVEELLLDQAQLLTLTAPEMAVLLGGMRVLGANKDGAKHGVLTKRPGMLTNDFFVNLLDMRTTWKATSEFKDIFEARDVATDQLEWSGSRADLVIGSYAQLRALAEVYASPDAHGKFVQDFVTAWNKVMNLTAMTSQGRERSTSPRARMKSWAGWGSG